MPEIQFQTEENAEELKAQFNQSKKHKLYHNSQDTTVSSYISKHVIWQCWLWNSPLKIWKQTQKKTTLPYVMMTLP